MPLSKQESEVDMIAKAIQGLIAQAGHDGSCVMTARSASMIAKFHPNSGLTASEIADRITMAAVFARVPTEMSKGRVAH